MKAIERMKKLKTFWRCAGCGAAHKTESRAWWCCMKGGIAPGAKS